MMGPQTAESNALLQSVMQGRLDFFRSCSLYSPLPSAAFQQNENTCYCASGLNFAPCNGVIGDSEVVPSEEEIQNAVSFFQSRQLPFLWWTSANSLEKKGFQFGGVLTGIAVDISETLPVQKISPRIQVKIIDSKDDLGMFATVAATAFGMGPALAQPLQAHITALMNHEEQVHFLAWIDGAPVGTVTLSTSAASAGIWNLSTAPEYRKNGVGTALVAAALVEAKRRQYERVMGILMPKGMAWTLTKKLGFQEVCQFPFYVYGASAEELEK